MSPSDLAKKRGKGPKPPGERRKRVKKEVVKETSKTMVQPYVEQFKWRSGPPPPGEEWNRYVGRSKPTQPIDMSFAETVLSGRGVRPSAPIPQDSLEEELEPSRADPEANREKKVSKE